MAIVNRPLPSESINPAQGSDARIFLQMFGTPLDKAQFMGRVTLTSELGVEREDSDIIEVPSDSKRGQWVKVGEIVKSLGTGTFDFEQQVDIALSDLWDDLHKNKTRFTLYVLLGNKVDHPANFGSYTGVLVLQNCSLSNIQRGSTFNPRTSDDAEQILLTGSAMYWEIEPFRTINISSIGGATVDKNVLDVIVRETEDERNNEIFALTTNASGSEPSALVYYKDNGTISQTDITALASNTAGSALGIMGNYVVVLKNVSGSEAHLWSTLADARSASDNFTAVTAGYVSAKGGNGMYVLDVANAWIAGQGGYIYKMTNPTQAVTVVSAGGVTTQNLSAIDGYGQQIIAVGASSAVVLSNDFGSTWVSASAPASGLTLTDVSMVAKDTWYVTATNGRVYYTNDGGVTYTSLALPIALSSVTDIQMVKTAGGYSSFGYIAGNDGSASYLLRTKDGGNTWENGLPSVKGFATAFSGVGAVTALSLANSHLIAIAGSTTLAIGKHN